MRIVTPPTQPSPRSDDAAAPERNLLAVAAHELRQPLNAVEVAWQLTQRASDPEVRARARQVIDRQLRIMHALVDRILEHERADRSASALRFAAVDLNVLAREQGEAFQLVAGEREVPLWTVLAPTPVRVWADADAIRRVLNNLLDNAIRHSPRGCTMTLHVRQERRYAVLEVRDSGDGIAADTLARIFEPFERGTERSNGLGLGLALVRQIVEAHHGRVAALSDGIGRGSRFIVHLPLATTPRS